MVNDLCDSCSHFKTLSLHECHGVLSERHVECSCECEKSEEAKDRADQCRAAGGVSITDAFRRLQEAIQSASIPYAQFSHSMNTGNYNDASFTINTVD